MGCKRVSCALLMRCMPMQGHGKRVAIQEFSKTSRGGRGVIAIKTSPTDRLAAVHVVGYGSGGLHMTYLILDILAGAVQSAVWSASYMANGSCHNPHVVMGCLV